MTTRRSSRKRLTPKQRVLKRWPKAVSWQTPLKKHWFISKPDWAGKDIGYGRTANSAWADAARRLK